MRTLAMSTYRGHEFQKTQQRGKSRSNMSQKLQEGQSGRNRMKGENKKLSQRQGPD